MRSGLAPCAEPGCPELTTNPRCDDHRRARLRAQDKLRPGTADRGYGYAHQVQRAIERARVLRGEAVCPTCGRRIGPGEAWDMGHTDDRTGYVGAQHVACNRDTRSGRATP